MHTVMFYDLPQSLEIQHNEDQALHQYFQVIQNFCNDSGNVENTSITISLPFRMQGFRGQASFYMIPNYRPVYFLVNAPLLTSNL